MKRIVIGDPHGRWGLVKQIYDKEQPDEVIILGDYFDSFNIDAVTQRESYNHIIELRNEHRRNKKGWFKLLIGNHDFHYMSPKFDRCSGWNEFTDSQAGYPLKRDWDNGILMMAVCDTFNKTIYSHAGVSRNWFDKWCDGSLESINTVEDKAFCFTYRDGGDEYGSSSWNSPLWIRPEGLFKAPYKDKDGVIWNQVFGHTEPCSPMHKNIAGADFYCIDCIKRNYLVEEMTDEKIITHRYLGEVMM